jgi:integrase
MRDTLPLYKRGGIWWCRVRDRRGRIVRRSTKCRDYQAAVAAYREFERTAADPAHATASETALGRAVSDYFVDLGYRKVSAATLGKERTKVGHFIRIWKEDLPMSAIDAALVREYIARREGEGVKSHTVKMELATLTRVIKVGRHLGKFHRTIEQVMPTKYGSGHVPRKRWLTGDELGRLLAQVPKFRAAHLAFIVAVGARWGESVRARAEDVNEDRSLVLLRGTKTPDAWAQVPVTDVTRGLFDFALDNAPSKAPLFRPWGKAGRDIKAACKRAGIAPCSPNDLRRSMGHWYLHSGLTPKQIGPMLRHTTDHLAQTTYASARGRELLELVRPMLAPSAVSVLYQTTTNAGASDEYQDAETPENEAPPGELESPTFALGMRIQSHALARENKGSCGSGVGAAVSILTATDSADSAVNAEPPPAEEPPSGGALSRAEIAALAATTARLRGGVDLTPGVLSRAAGALTSLRVAAVGGLR